jgi:hypothetical protein
VTAPHIRPLFLPAGRHARRAALGLLATAALAAAGGCSPNAATAAPVRPAALPACHSPEAALLPHTAGSLTQADTGAYCLSPGQTLDVFLTAPTAADQPARWSKVTIGDTAVLAYGNSGVMTPPLDVTPGVVVGLGRGTSTVTSTLPDGKTWTATIVVS